VGNGSALAIHDVRQALAAYEHMLRRALAAWPDEVALLGAHMAAHKVNALAGLVPLLTQSAQALLAAHRRLAAALWPEGSTADQDEVRRALQEHGMRLEDFRKACGAG
jgi:hypothetical protein